MKTSTRQRTYAKPVEAKTPAEHRSPKTDGVKVAARHADVLVADDNLLVQAMLAQGAIQPTLAITPPDDPLEREADEVADAVVQRKEACSCGGSCEECQQREQIQLRRNATHAHRDSQMSASPRLMSRLGSGRSLDPTTRRFFGANLGHDFGRTRIHTDANAAASADSINARAYTYGDDVVFGRNQYQPHTTEGAKLLAHELTHVVQQREHSAEPPIQRQPNEGGPMSSLLPVAHQDRLDAIAKVAQDIERKRGEFQSTQSKIDALPAVSDESVDAQRTALTAELKELEQRINALLGEHLELVENAITELQAVLPGEDAEYSPSAESVQDVQMEIQRLQQEVLPYKRMLAREEIKEINAQLAGESLKFPMSLSEFDRQQLELRKHTLSEFLSGTAQNRAAPGSHGRLDDGRCYAVYQHEVRADGKPGWRFHNRGSLGRGPSVTEDPPGVMAHVPPKDCGAQVGLYIFLSDEAGKDAVKDDLDRQADLGIGAGSFLLAFSHEGQKYLDGIKEECRRLDVGTAKSANEANENDKGVNLSALKNGDPDLYECLKRAIFKIETGKATAGAGDTITCGHTEEAADARALLGCDDDTIQPKLNAPQGDDPLEREADGVADAVVQRKEACSCGGSCEECQQREQIQLKRTGPIQRQEDTTSTAADTAAETESADGAAPSPSPLDADCPMRLPDLELFEERSRLDEFLNEVWEADLLSKEIDLGFLGSAAVNVTAAYEAHGNLDSVLGPGRIRNICVGADFESGSHQGSAELLIPAYLQAWIDVDGNIHGEAGHSALGDLHLDGEATADGEGLLGAYLSVPVVITYDNGEISFNGAGEIAGGATVSGSYLADAVLNVAGNEVWSEHWEGEQELAAAARIGARLSFRYVDGEFQDLTFEPFAEEFSAEEFVDRLMGGGEKEGDDPCAIRFPDLTIMEAREMEPRQLFEDVTTPPYTFYDGPFEAGTIVGWLNAYAIGSASGEISGQVGPLTVRDICFGGSPIDDRYAGSAMLALPLNVIPVVDLDGSVGVDLAAIGAIGEIPIVFVGDVLGGVGLRGEANIVTAIMVPVEIVLDQEGIHGNAAFEIGAGLDFGVTGTAHVRFSLYGIDFGPYRWNLGTLYQTSLAGKIGGRLTFDYIEGELTHELEWFAEGMDLSELLKLLSDDKTGPRPSPDGNDPGEEDGNGDEEGADERDGEEERTVVEDPLTAARARTLPEIGRQLDQPRHTPSTLTLVDGASSQVGIHMISRYITDATEMGSGTNPGVQSELYGYGKLPAAGDLGSGKGQGKSIQFIKGHLLNYHRSRGLGGFAITSNLYPITGLANSRHNLYVEERVKDLVHRDHLLVMYEVDVANVEGPHKFDAFEGDPDKTCMYQFVNADFICNYATYRLYSDNTVELNTSTEYIVDEEFDVEGFRARMQDKDCPKKP